jgi:hypothetical protein
MRLQDRNAQEDEEVEIRGHTVRVLVWVEPEEERYEDVYGEPPPEGCEFWWVRAEARLDDFSGSDSLGFVDDCGTRDSREYFKGQVEEIKENAIRDLFDNVEKVAKGGEKFGYQARRGAARGITSKLRGNSRWDESTWSSEEDVWELTPGQSATYLGYTIEVTDIGTVLLDGTPMDDLEGATRAARAWRREEEYEGHCESEEARRKAEYEGEYEENARRPTWHRPGGYLGVSSAPSEEESVSYFVHPEGDTARLQEADGRAYIHYKTPGGTMQTISFATLAEAKKRLREDGFRAEGLSSNRSWSSREKHNLPASSFLYHHGDVRKLPFKDAQGRVSCSHLRNALARLGHTDIPERAKAAVRRRAEELLAKHCGGYER